MEKSNGAQNDTLALQDRKALRFARPAKTTMSQAILPDSRPAECDTRRIDAIAHQS
jgi:hypothetical protein